MENFAYSSDKNDRGVAMRFSELRQKEVINCRDGCRMGFVADLEFDERTGQICQLIIPEVGKLWSCFGRGAEYCICYNEIVRIGSDIIIVDVDSKMTKERCKVDKKH